MMGRIGERAAGFPRCRRRVLRFEPLEKRWLLSITVDTLVDELDNSVVDGDISLRDALAAAPAGETIDFDASLDGGTILLTMGELFVTKALTIDATTLPSSLTIDASGNDPTPDEDNGDGSRVFNIDDGDDSTRVEVAIGSLTLTGGDVGGDGGAILALEDLTVTESTISGNNSARGRDRFGFNGSGGGVFSHGALTVTESTIAGNLAYYYGGGVAADNDVTITGSTISGNSSRRSGGGISGGNVTVTSSIISGNRGANIGGVRASDAVSITSSIISGNSGSGISSGNVTVTSSTISGNSGSGISGIGGGNVTISSSTISRNSGGGISGGNVTVTSSTISGNHGAVGGVNASGAVSITSSTILGNSSRWASGGGIGSHGAPITIWNSIVSGNTDGGTAPDVFADTGRLTVRFSLIGDNTGAGIVEAPVGVPDAHGNLIGGPINGILDPLLAPLADNGGLTQTHALRPNSPAIDAGDPDFTPPPNFDQRGVGYTRVSGPRIDMGAHERQGLTVEILGVSTPRLTTVDEVTIEFSSEVIGFDVEDLELSLNGGNNLLTDGQTLTTNDNRSFLLASLADVTAASGYYTISLVSSESDIVDAAGNPLDSGDTMSWAMGRMNLEITVDTLLDEADGSIDDGDISLRDALAAAAPGESIDFDSSLDGGTILLTEGELEISNSLIIDATPLPLGLTIDVSASDPTPEVDNGDGSRVFNIDDGDDSSRVEVVIRGLTLTGGDVSGDGGAILTHETLMISANTISNRASGSGGGIWASGNVTISSSTISRNNNARSGAGIVGSRVAVTSSTISGNSGVGIAGGNVTVTSSTVSKNYGGGISGGNVTVTSSTISGNGSYYVGGISASGNVTITSSTISGNSSYYGGIISASGNVTITSSTISGNGSYLGGGGGGISASGDVTVNSSTIWGNSTVGITADGIMTIDNSIVYDLGPSTAALTVRYSLIGDNTGTDLAEAPVGMPDANGNLIGDPNGMGIINPRLAPLSDNGGFTKTHALHSDSPAVNAGDVAFSPPPDFDQRGAPFVRVSGGRIDMGAFERQSVAAVDLVVDTLVDEMDNDFSNGDFSLREALSIANNTPGADMIMFGASLDGGTILLKRGELVAFDAVVIEASTLSGGLTIDASGNDPTPDDDNGDGSRVFKFDDGDKA